MKFSTLHTTHILNYSREMLDNNGVAGNSCYWRFFEWATSLINLYSALRSLSHDIVHGIGYQHLLCVSVVMASTDHEGTTCS